MILSDKLLALAKLLEEETDELLIDASDEQLDSLALSLVHASETLKEAAEEFKTMEVAEPKELFTAEKLEEMAAVAAAFDESGDELLVKQASVLDEILMTIAVSKDYLADQKKMQEAKMDTLKKRYKATKEEIDANIGVKEAVEALKKSPAYQTYRPLQFGLQTRNCPDHAGAQMGRVSEGKFQCSIDHKVYDYESGYTLLNGDKVPGGSVQEQTPSHAEESHQMFDTRSARLGMDV